MSRTHPLTNAVAAGYTAIAKALVTTLITTENHKVILRSILSRESIEGLIAQITDIELRAPQEVKDTAIEIKTRLELAKGNIRRAARMRDALIEAINLCVTDAQQQGIKISEKPFSNLVEIL